MNIDESYKPLVTGIIAEGNPKIYAYRAVTQIPDYEGESFAQGSPLWGAFEQVEAKIRTDYPNGYDSGYPVLGLYNDVRSLAGQFLNSSALTGPHYFNDTTSQRHLIVSGYARSGLQESMNSIARQVGGAKSILMLQAGWWPLLEDMADLTGYEFQAVPRSYPNRFPFSDFAAKLAQTPDDANIVIYNCNPGNPTSDFSPREDIVQFAIDVENYNAEQERLGLKRRVHVMHDTPYPLWVGPDLIQNGNYPFVTNILLDASKELGRDLTKYQLEVISHGKGFGLAFLGASIVYCGNPELTRPINKRLTTGHNMPGTPSLLYHKYSLEHAMTPAGRAEILSRAHEIHRNLQTLRREIEIAAQKQRLPIEVVGQPEHGPYLCVRLKGDGLQGKRRIAIRGKCWDIIGPDPEATAIYLLEREHEGVAVVPLGQNNVPNSLRFFVNVPPDVLRAGTERFLRGISKITNTPAVPF